MEYKLIVSRMKSCFHLLLLFGLLSLFRISEQQEHIISKRGIKTYTCTGKKCENGHCTSRSYVGPTPPAWCQGGPFNRQSASSWSRHCENNVCTEKSHFGQTFDSNDNRSTFNVDCVKGICTVTSCNKNGCGNQKKISESELQRDIAGMPRCGSHNRRKRSFLSWLIGYCCDITNRWDGHKIIAIVPVRSGAFG